MGSLILCHRKRARQPYEIARIHMRIYTIEELCYYICNNLYLIDYTMVNRQLCNWIDKELELPKLAEKLREELRQNGSMEQFAELENNQGARKVSIAVNSSAVLANDQQAWLYIPQ